MIHNEHGQNMPLNAAGLAIKTSSSAIVKTTNTINYVIDGKLYSKAAADLTALTGYNVSDTYTAVLAVMLDSAGTASYVKSPELANASTFTTDMFITPNNGKSLIGWIIIKNASGAAFTGGTTALDASNVTVTYFDVYDILSR